YKDHYTAKLNVSVYSEKFGFQYARGTVGYRTKVSAVTLCGEYFFGSAFNGFYYNTGAVLSADASLGGWFLADACVAPWYDSGYGYTTCFEARIGARITEEIAVKVGYTTIPEFRMSENRILAGVDFRVSRLSVSPCLSIGTKAADGGKNIRILFDFAYRF
ncbi:MAG: hypothetical protein K2M12_01720, partial [Muribaculaceae bacterium]|nr:hypothetical protein [Muribaculaceae bacterium]